MSQSTSVLDHAPVADKATVSRVKILAVVLGITAVLAAVGGVFWPEPEGGGETYLYSDIAPDRDLWFLLLGGLTINGIVTVTLQALATMFLIRERGHVWATVGGALMWVGIAVQGTGVAGWASAYFYPTDSSVDKAVGSAVIEAANDDQAHLFGLLGVGAVLVIVGSVLQAVAMFRAKVVPVWVPIGTLFAIITLLVPGNGVLGLITSLPMAAAAIALGYYALRRVSS